MLSKIETDKILNIEKDCEALLQKCRLLRLESAPPSPDRNFKKKRKQNIVDELIAKNLEKLFK
jgi:hypothetical protein